MEIPELITDTTKRQEFVFLFDVTNGNPNGDPDAGNAPRVDPETGQGLVTDVALKRKIRNRVHLATGMAMFIQSEMALNTVIIESAKGLNPPLSKDETKSKGRPIRRLQERLCQQYYDIRMFGAVLSTGRGESVPNAGQVRGPAQLTFARSIHPIFAADHGISRCARTREDDLNRTGPTELGRKSTVPYGLYLGHGFINPFLAEQTRVTPDDLRVFWEALCHLFDFDQSAARPRMDVCGLYVFTHPNQLGVSPARDQFKRVRVKRREDGAELPAR